MADTEDKREDLNEQASADGKAAPLPQPTARKTIRGKSYVKIDGAWYEE